MKKQSLMWVVAMVAGLGFGARADMKCSMKEGDCETKKAEMLDARVQHLTKELGLDADQQMKVKAVLEKKMAEKCAIHEEAAKKMGEAKDAAQGEIRALLTPEQQAKFDAVKGKGDCCAMAEKKGEMCPMCHGPKGKKGKKEKAMCPMHHGKSK